MMPPDVHPSKIGCDRHTSMVYKSGMVCCPKCGNWYRPKGSR